MKTQSSTLWAQLRTAYRPEVPELDTAAIMAAVRQEARTPVRRTAAGMAAAIPGWACTAAAVLAIFASGFVVGRAFNVADQHIRAAWTQSVQPEEFATTFLSYEPARDDSSL
ncbi:MAG TPA: hypothetical protein PLD40_08645 [Kiritimatiellia bacterium]|jgi:hypothetical protein|nr:MAG: hypothetical protein BWX54_01346 [Verrucomicrobia bacterium ADurb.Bin018]HOE00286.1 hypothetical protein [Kiritimatiellia bacterium]HOE36146.1 hypothetical protein [Kiritimatiellia bacterium]HOR73780.1 hypothetical protein [Kiritimatiellia bacterium]HOU58184.1 hypothetical protein [Kiritimatiellia bacterium]